MSRVFVDTNALIYSDQVNSAFHERARSALGRLEQDGNELWISRQIVREYLATVTKPGAGVMPPMTRHAAIAAAEGFTTAYELAEDGPNVTARLLELVRAVPVGGKQIHDANIAATMLAHGITRLLTFNAADFRRFAGRIELVAP